MMVYRPYKSPYKRVRKTRVVPGITRVGGYYGRFSGINKEYKFFDLDVDDAVVAVGVAVFDSVNKIAQGVTESTRIGRKCTVKSFQWRYSITLPARDSVATPENGDAVRVILYVDKQCNGATATAANILETSLIHSFYNLANESRFTILMDKTHTINYANLASDGAGVHSMSKVIHEYRFNKRLNLPLEFDSTTGAITEIRSNNIGVILVGSQGDLGFDSKLRIRFSDS